MSKRRGKNVFLSLVFFFLKTFFFNPLNNPVFVVLAILIVFFYVEGSLDKYHVALMLYVSVVSHYFVGNMFTDHASNEEGTSRVPIMRYFQALPISGQGVYSSYFFSSIMYSVFMYVMLGLLLTKFMKLPNLKYMEFIQSVTSDGDTMTTVTGIAFSRRFIPRFVSFVLEKSLFFTAISKTGGASFLVLSYFILTFVYISVFQVFKQFKRRHRLSFSGLFHWFPLGVYLLLALVFLTEVILSQKEIGICIRSILQYWDVAIILFLLTVILTFVSIVIMSKSILNELKALSS